MDCFLGLSRFVARCVVGVPLLLVAGCAASILGLDENTYDVETYCAAASKAAVAGTPLSPECTGWCQNTDRAGAAGCDTITSGSDSGSDSGTRPDGMLPADGAMSTDGEVSTDGSLPQGCGPGLRYTVITPSTPDCTTATSINDGTGRVLDKTTGLTWASKSYEPSTGLSQADANAYCASQGMRMPTQREALGIRATINGGRIEFDQVCAFPCAWGTWTSSAAGDGIAWIVGWQGNSLTQRVDKHASVLCVQ